ncbi:alkaline phosphatase family protein [Arthrobacter sp. 35W]|uniref:alkaline phosphatase family protein n=1 Tax=Arthrobacter sp. 35W TaxID=1132441 RepID=UPI00042895BA|nr:nucleotide pyrophosphatase/phosphodiesterase family protein [Arthrobacter sp. 35W]
MSLDAQPALPAAPGYGHASIADVLTSSAAAAGAPGFANTLQLPNAPRVCVVLVDGLGKALLKQRAAHAPFLRGVLGSDGGRHPATISSAFPSTTATSLTSLGTGVAPGLHGMVGYDVLDPDQDKVVNLLGHWDPGVDPLRWQPYPTVFERLDGHLPSTTISLPKFASSPMTRAALRGSTFVGAATAHARTEAAAEQMAAHKNMLMYFYWAELDKAGHAHGSSSAQWEHQLEELDAAVKRLATQLPADTLLLLTADHGMVDVAASARVDYSAHPELVAGVRHTAGEPRMVHLYLEPDAGEAVRDALVAAWLARFGNKAWVLTRAQAIAAGFFGPEVRPEVAGRIGDVLIAAREPIAFYDTRRVNPSALEVVGQHGSITRAEREVPLLQIPVSGAGRATGRKRR